MAYGLTLQGFNPKPFTQIKVELDSDFKGAYGNSIGSNSDGSIPAKSKIGQFIGIFGFYLAELWDLGQAVYSAMDPDKAEGAALEAISAITGTIRNGQRPSTAILTATGDPGTSLLTGRIVSVVGSNTRFATNADITLVALSAWTASTPYLIGQRITNASRVYLCIASGVSTVGSGPTTTGAVIVDGTVNWRYLGEGTAAADVMAIAQVAGPFAALSGTLTNIETPINGWKSAMNILDAVVGALEETEAALRIRRENELQAESNGTLDAIRANILRVGQGTPNPVTACTVFENTTMVTNGDGLPPKSIEALVLGGEDAAILKTVFTSKDAGIESYGNVSGNVADTAGNIHLTKFSRATEIDIWIEVDITKLADEFPIDGVAQVVSAILIGLTAPRSYSFGKDVTIWGITNNIDSVAGVLDVTAVRVGTAPSPSGTANIPIGVRQIARFDSSRVLVTAVDGTP